MKSPRVVLYLRVSTKPQELRGQRASLEDFCDRRGWKVSKVYAEKVSGSGAPRTELDRLMRDARAGLFDTIVIFKLDRLGRSWAHLAQTVTELNALQIGLVAASQGIDTSAGNPVAGLQIGLLAAFAEFDAEMIRDRARTGLAAAKARGVRLGRPGIGSDKETAIADAWRTKNGLGGMRAIAKRCGVSLGKVQSVIANLRAADVQKIPLAKPRRRAELAAASTARS